MIIYLYFLLFTLSIGYLYLTANGQYAPMLTRESDLDVNLTFTLPMNIHKLTPDSKWSSLIKSQENIMLLSIVTKFHENLIKTVWLLGRVIMWWVELRNWSVLCLSHYLCLYCVTLLTLNIGLNLEQLVFYLLLYVHHQQ